MTAVCGITVPLHDCVVNPSANRIRSRPTSLTLSGSFDWATCSSRAPIGCRAGGGAEPLLGDQPSPSKLISSILAHVRKRLRFVLRGRELGFNIEEIRGLLGLVDGGSQTCPEVRARTQHHLKDIRGKIADLRRIETILAKMAAQCSGNEVRECAILEALGS